VIRSPGNLSRSGFGFERVFEVEVPSPEAPEKKVKLQASLEPCIV
jgi:hypothetical protein